LISLLVIVNVGTILVMVMGVLAFILPVDMRVAVCMSVLVGMDYTVMAMFMGV
jgi:hypothetical protein